jgi:hypothetical protein
MFSSADLSLAEGKMRKNLLVTGGLRYDFTESHRPLPLSIFSVKIAALGVFEAGYRKDFQN